MPAGAVYPVMLGAVDGRMAEEYYEMEGKDQFQMCGGGSGVGRPIPGELAETDAPAITTSDAEDIRDGVAADVRAAHASRPGTVPAGILIWADQRARLFRRDWRRELSATVRSCMREHQRGRTDYTWARLPRRVRPSIPLRPGSCAPKPRIGIIVDTSGSMLEHGDIVKGVVEGVHRAASGAIVWSCDTQIHRSHRSYCGGGGTDIRVGIQAALDAKCDIVVAVTDGQTPWPGPDTTFPLIVALIGTDPGEIPSNARIVRVGA
jgi:hypothetical protein